MHIVHYSLSHSNINATDCLEGPYIGDISPKLAYLSQITCPINLVLVNMNVYHTQIYKDFTVKFGWLVMRPIISMDLTGMLNLPRSTGNAR